MPTPLSGRFNLPRSPGAPAIFSAVMEGDLDAVRNIIDADKASVDARDRAAHFGHKALVGQLLNLGADPLVRDAAGQNAADWANSGGHADIAALLKAPKIRPAGPKP